MARPKKYNDEELLKAAAEVFLEHGMAAGTALIAERAGVSEGVLFKRFKTKEALFEAALTLEMGSNEWRQDLIRSAGKNSPQSNLKRAILALFDKLHRFIPKLMVLEGQGHRRPPPSGTQSPPLEDAAAISAYLKKESKIGRLRIANPELHAHEIVGAVVHSTMLKLRHKTEICSREQWADHLVKVHLADAGAKQLRPASLKSQR